MKNARFWQWVNCGWVKLTLRPDQQLSHSVFQRTDEGWERDTETWLLEDGVVVNSWLFEARDCDGRLDKHGERSAAIADLRAVDMFAETDGELPENSGIWVPLWMKGDCGQRDYAAEAAGY